MTESNNCVRCKTALPSNTSFCAACGFTNHSATAKKGLEVEKGLEARAARRSLVRKLTAFFRIAGR